MRILARPNLGVQRTRVKQRLSLPASCPRAADAGRYAAFEVDMTSYADL